MELAFVNLTELSEMFGYMSQLPIQVCLFNSEDKNSFGTLSSAEWTLISSDPLDFLINYKDGSCEGLC